MGNSAPASSCGSRPEDRNISHTETCVTAKSSGLSGNKTQCSLLSTSAALQKFCKLLKANAACSVEKNSKLDKFPGSDYNTMQEHTPPLHLISTISWQSVGINNLSFTQGIPVCSLW